MEVIEIVTEFPAFRCLTFFDFEFLPALMLHCCNSLQRPLINLAMSDGLFFPSPWINMVKIINILIIIQQHLCCSCYKVFPGDLSVSSFILENLISKLISSRKFYY